MFGEVLVEGGGAHGPRPTDPRDEMVTGFLFGTGFFVSLGGAVNPIGHRVSTCSEENSIFSGFFADISL